MGEDKGRYNNDKLEYEIFKDTLDSCPIGSSRYKFFSGLRVETTVVFRVARLWYIQFYSKGEFDMGFMWIR